MGFLRKESSLISYTIDKGFTNNLAISVQNGQVAVTAPWYISRKKIEQIIIDRKRWIMKKIKEYEELNLAKKSTFENQIIRVSGEDYSIKILYKMINIPELNLENKIIRINLPIKYRNIDNTKIIILILEKFYKRLAETKIEEIMESTRIMTGLAPEDYVFSKMKGILAKFDAENKIIIINPEIVKYNEEIIKYIILHEFCHLKYKTHAKNFYKLIEKYIPNYKSVENKIEEMF